MIKGRSRVSIPINSVLMKNGFLSETVEVHVEHINGEDFVFHTTISLAFPGYGAKFGGETDEHWLGYNGPYYVQIEKRNHIVKIGSIRSTQDPMTLLSPKIGKPFSEEFSKKEASSIEYIELPEGFVMKTSLTSEAFAPLILNTYLKIFGDGLVEIKHEVVNKGKEILNNIFLLQPLFTEFKGMAIPQKDGVMIGDEALIPFMEYIRDKDISERWIFTSNTEGESKGLAWSKDAVGRKDDWKFSIEYPIESIAAEDELCFGPIQVGINIANSWSQWRDLVVGEDPPYMKEDPLYALEAQGGGFISSVGEKVDYTFRSMLTPYVYGSLTLQNEDMTFVRKANKENAVTKIHLELEHHTPGVKNITGHFHSPSQRADLHTLQLVKGNREVNVSKNEDGWYVENGVISFKASSEYYPGIYSLMYEGKESFHHQFPKTGPKAWWNPWGGGARYKFHNVSDYFMMKEQTTIDSVTKKDENGHSWTGLCLSTTFKEHETMKGITLRQYALTLPEVPILALYGEIQQDSNRTFTKELLDLEAFFKPGEDLTSCYAKLPTEGVFHTYYAGVEEFVLRDTPYVTIGSDDREERLTLVHPSTKKLAELYMNQEVFLTASEQEWSASSGEVTTVKPTIMFYGEGNVPRVMNQLRGITFK